MCFIQDLIANDVGADYHYIGFYDDETDEETDEESDESVMIYHFSTTSYKLQDASLTLIVGLKSAVTLFLSLVGRGSPVALPSSDRLRWTVRRQTNCSDATFLVTHRVYTWQPAAT